MGAPSGYSVSPSDSTEESSLYRRLWLTVILRAVEEAGGKNLFAGKRNPQKIQDDAREWLASGNADFRIVCNWAGFDEEKTEKLRRRYVTGTDRTTY